MSSSDLGPRCLHPMTYYDIPGRAEGLRDIFPVCWRPAGHPGNRHLSQFAYEREQARKNAARSRYPQPSWRERRRRRQARVLSEGAVSVAA